MLESVSAREHRTHFLGLMSWTAAYVLQARHSPLLQILSQQWEWPWGGLLRQRWGGRKMHLLMWAMCQSQRSAQACP